jgi:ligand-binding sensor domain-containing protein
MRVIKLLLFQISFISLLLAALAPFSQPAAQMPAKQWLSYLSPEEITALTVAEDDIWAATYGGVIHWNHATGQYRLYSSSDGVPEDKIIALNLDPAGRPWATSEYRGLSYLSMARVGRSIPPRMACLSNPLQRLSLSPTAGPGWEPTEGG